VARGASWGGAQALNGNRSTHSNSRLLFITPMIPRLGGLQRMPIVSCALGIVFIAPRAASKLLVNPSNQIKKG
jgi:hypothetical protein